ncbi:MAG: helix-turn-helix domain-containing protein [Planctomycetota bacterium]
MTQHASLFGDATPTPIPAPTPKPCEKTTGKRSGKPKTMPPPPQHAAASPSVPAPHFDPETPLLVSEREAAKLLAISPRTLWSLRQSGEIPCIRIGRAVRYSVAELSAWVDRQASGTTS